MFEKLFYVYLFFSFITFLILYAGRKSMLSGFTTKAKSEGHNYSELYTSVWVNLIGLFVVPFIPVLNMVIPYKVIVFAINSYKGKQVSK